MTAPTAAAAIGAVNWRSSVARDAPCHGSCGPTPMRNRSARASGISTRSKYGRPIESCAPETASAMSGYSVPSSTVSVAATNTTFWKRKIASRESGAPSPPASASCGIRQQQAHGQHDDHDEIAE